MDRPTTTAPDEGARYAHFQRAQEHDDAGRYELAFLDYHASGALQHATQMVEAVGLAAILRLDPSPLP